MIIKQYKKQRGAALAVSLILLVAMTILGVASLNSTRMSERVSSNAQQKAIVFETSESVINSMTSAVDFQDKLRASRTSNLEPDAVIQTTETDILNNELDQTNTLGTSVDVTAEASIQFCAERPKDGSEVSADESVNGQTGVEFDVRAQSNIANSNARADHVMRVSIPGIQFYSTGKCVIPGS